MKNSHIIDILDEKAFAELNAAELRAIESHTSACNSCADAFRAARISSAMLRAEPVEEFAAPPFFETRVLAALREKREKANPFHALVRMWRASAAMIVMMAAMTVGLIGLTVFAPEFNDAATASRNAATDIYGTDLVIADERIPTKEPTNEQILRIIYAPEGSGKK